LTEAHFTSVGVLASAVVARLITLNLDGALRTALWT